MTDQEIIVLFFERSEQALTELSVRYGAAVRSTVRSVLKNEQDAEECVSDAYLQIWNSIPPHRPEHLGAFFCRIARSAALNRHHFNSAHKRGRNRCEALDELAESIPSGSTVESDYDAAELAGHINRFLGTLPADDRDMFLQRYWLGASVTQTAQNMELSAAATSLRLFRIRKKLKNYLMKEGIFA